MTAVYKKNLELLPELDQFPSSENDFLKDIQAKANKYLLSDRQIEAAQRAWDRIKTAQLSGQPILSPWDENVKRFPELNTANFREILQSSSNEFMFDLYSKARRFILSDKQIEALKTVYKRENNFYVPTDKQAFDLVIRAVALTPRGDWILRELGDYYNSHRIKMGIYTIIMEKVHHFRKSIFKNIFNSDLDKALYYIGRIDWEIK